MQNDLGKHMQYGRIVHIEGENKRLFSDSPSNYAKKNGRMVVILCTHLKRLR